MSKNISIWWSIAALVAVFGLGYWWFSATNPEPITSVMEEKATTTEPTTSTTTPKEESTTTPTKVIEVEIKG